MASAEPASTACSIAVSAPSRRISAQANGPFSGVPVRGSGTQAQLVTSPASPTGTSSVRASEDWGSYSTGGHITPPSAIRTPTSTPSRNPVKKADCTGPTVRVNGYSTTRGALRTSLSLIAAETRTRSMPLVAAGAAPAAYGSVVTVS